MSANNSTGGCPKCAGQAACWCPPDPLPTSAEVEHNRQQTLGLSSCPEDAEGNECELCAEQIERLRAAQHAASRRAVLEEVQDAWRKHFHGAEFANWLTSQFQDGSHG